MDSQKRWSHCSDVPLTIRHPRSARTRLCNLSRGNRTCGPKSRRLKPNSVDSWMSLRATTIKQMSNQGRWSQARAAGNLWADRLAQPSGALCPICHIVCIFEGDDRAYTLQAAVKTTSHCPCEARGQGFLTIIATIPPLLLLGEPSGEDPRGPHHSGKGQGPHKISRRIGRRRCATDRLRHGILLPEAAEARQSWLFRPAISQPRHISNDGRIGIRYP